MIGDFLKNDGLLLGLGAVSAVALIGWVAPSLQNPDRVNTTPVERAVFVPAQVQEQVQTPAAEAPAPVRPRKWYQASVQKPSPTVAHRAIPAEAPPVPQESPRLKQRPVEVPAAERSEPQAQVENRPPARRDPVVVERSRDKSIAIMAGGAALGAAIGAIAGHGKGAAIGALSGGAIGVVYDRMTRRRTVEPDVSTHPTPATATRNIF